MILLLAQYNFHVKLSFPAIGIHNLHSQTHRSDIILKPNLCVYVKIVFQVSIIFRQQINLWRFQADKHILHINQSHQGRSAV